MTQWVHFTSAKPKIQLFPVFVKLFAKKKAPLPPCGLSRGLIVVIQEIHEFV